MLPSGTPLFFDTSLSLIAILNAGIRIGIHIAQGERCSMEMWPRCERHQWQMIGWRGREASNPEDSTTTAKGPGLGHLVALFACGWVSAL